MANLHKIVYLTEQQKNELFSQGSVTSNGTTITYNQNDLYITPDKSIDSISMNGTTYTPTNGAVNLGNVLTPASGKANNSIIAPVELTSTASQLYNIGDLFIYNDQLYKATNTIATSTTIIPDTNCTSILLIDQMNDNYVLKNGSYTTAEKVIIQKTIGLYNPPWEFIREDTFTNATEDTHTITVDANGDAFELTDVIMFFETPNQSTYSAKGQYGQIWFWYNASYYFASEPGAWTQNADTSAHGFVTIVEQQPGGLFFCRETGVTTSSNSAAWRSRYSAGFNENATAQGIKFTNDTLYISKIQIPKVTGTGHYKLYGKRKWT